MTPGLSCAPGLLKNISCDVEAPESRMHLHFNKMVPGVYTEMSMVLRKWIITHVQVG